jgi:hypothetical protein
MILPALHKDLRALYNVAVYFPEDKRFEDVLLSPRGVYASTSPTVDVVSQSDKNVFANHESYQLRMCKACYRHTSDQHNIAPPKFAVANGLAIGWLPEYLQDLTIGEIKMVSSCFTSLCFVGASERDFLDASKKSHFGVFLLGVPQNGIS